MKIYEETSMVMALLLSLKSSKNILPGQETLQQKIHFLTLLEIPPFIPKLRVKYLQGMFGWDNYMQL